jgi:hypothetical protein
MRSSSMKRLATSLLAGSLTLLAAGSAMAGLSLRVAPNTQGVFASVTDNGGGLLDSDFSADSGALTKAHAVSGDTQADAELDDNEGAARSFRFDLRLRDGLNGQAGTAKTAGGGVDFITFAIGSPDIPVGTPVQLQARGIFDSTAANASASHAIRIGGSTTAIPTNGSILTFNGLRVGDTFDYRALLQGDAPPNVDAFLLSGFLSVSVIPEPGTLALLGAGILPSLVVLRRRRA